MKEAIGGLFRSLGGLRKTKRETSVSGAYSLVEFQRDICPIQTRRVSNVPSCSVRHYKRSTQFFCGISKNTQFIQKL
jgi:hypothetical protein